MKVNMMKAHLPILKAFDEFKFNLGKKTLVDFLKGDLNKTIEKNHLDELNAYGCSYMIDKDVIENILDDLILREYLQIEIVSQFFKVVKRTKYGLKEIFEQKYAYDEAKAMPKVSGNSKFKFKYKEDPVNEQDKALFGAFSFF